MMLPEFSAGAGEHKPRAGHTAMWFRFPEMNLSGETFRFGKRGGHIWTTS